MVNLLKKDPVVILKLRTGNERISLLKTDRYGDGFNAIHIRDFLHYMFALT